MVHRNHLMMSQDSWSALDIMIYFVSRQGSSRSVHKDVWLPWQAVQASLYGMRRRQHRKRQDDVSKPLQEIRQCHRAGGTGGALAQRVWNQLVGKRKRTSIIIILPSSTSSKFLLIYPYLRYIAGVNVQWSISLRFLVSILRAIDHAAVAHL